MKFAVVKKLMEIFDAVLAVMSDASSPYTAQAGDDMLPWIV